MGLKSIPVASNEFTPPRHLGRDLAVEALLNGWRIHGPIRLSELGQATDADPAMPAKEAAHPNQQDQHRGRGDIAFVVGQRSQGVGPLAIRAVYRCLDLLVI